MKPFAFVVSPHGAVTTIYDDAHADFYAQGEAEVARASHVEPTPSGGWIADMSPAVERYHLECDNPILGPFLLRQQALDAETGWLREKLFGGGDAALD
jgi:hypothetical protein